MHLFYGVRLHPSVILLARSRQMRLSAGTSIGARSKIDVGDRGLVVTEAGVWISSDVELQSDSTVWIGARTTVQRRSSINGSVRLGRDCILAPNVFISSRGHPFRAFPHLTIREQEKKLAADIGVSANLDRPVCIQDDCWLGTNVVIGPGVTVGKGTVVGANSVVLSDTRPYSVVGGIPAKPIGTRLVWNPPVTVDLASPEDRVYLLSGAPILDVEGGVIAVTPNADEPVQIVLSQAAQVRVHYRAASRVRVKIGTRVREIDEGQGAFLVKAGDLQALGDSTVVSVSAEQGSAAGAIEISRMEVV